ncbi:MAG: hypothetical protein ACRYF9_14910 [Janthinobacterium lividum]|uniref:hypothetical protein n=1 Tax=Pseudomonas sp. MWU16-30317 TaxID=2878095 RepID=UPI001CFA79B5|nr:hypothetical protein [Pseudomonas sp. MWU16-30317]
MTKYVIRYLLNGERRWDFAHLNTGSLEEATAALKGIHGDDISQVSDIRVSKAL